MMYGDEKSGPVIVARNHANASGRPPAEGGAPRTGAKGNTPQTDTRRTPSRVSVSPGLERVRRAAKQSKEERFTALLHHVDIDLLRQAYFWLKPEAAPGVDGVTWQEYGQGLEQKLSDLHGRVHRGSYGRCRRGVGTSENRMDGSALWALRRWVSRHPDKTRLIEFGRHAAANRKRRGLGKPEAFDFLGFSVLQAHTERSSSWTDQSCG